ncbi:MAG TPA: hypothetical protein VFG54_22915, partial [Prolixibacteraceae bacterium]|nr:hypothetical protein [Prolixibacteraceae bacterium]
NTMKKAILIILAIVCVIQVQAQEPKSTWSLNVLLSHYDRVKDNELNLGDIDYNINPGLEIIYNYHFRNAFLFSTGVSYQFVNLQSFRETSDRLQVGEISIPVLFTLKGKSSPLSVSSGIYGGQFLHMDWDQNLHGRWETVNPNDREFYSDKDFFMDVYLDFAYTHKGLRIAPFVRYRFKDNWMDHYRLSVYYGIKFGISSLKRRD